MSGYRAGRCDSSTGEAALDRELYYWFRTDAERYRLFHGHREWFQSVACPVCRLQGWFQPRMSWLLERQASRELLVPD